MAKAKNKPRVVSNSVQLPLFRPESVWTAPAVATLPTWKGAKRVGIDVETRDDNLDEMGPGVRRGAYICGISFSIEDGPSHYLPIRHQGGDNLPVDQVLAYMKVQAAEYRGDICGGNLSYDLDFLAEEGITFWDCRFRDVMVAEPLLDEWRDSYSLENISHKYGYTGKNEELLRLAAAAWGWTTPKEVKKNIWRLPGRYVGPYGSEDARLPLLVLRKQERAIDAQDLQRIYDLECQVLPVLLKMRRRGVRIDFKKLDEVEAKTLVEQQVQHDIIRAETGIRVGFDDLDKKGIMAGVCEAAGIKLGRTPPSKGHPDGQIKIDKATLEAVVKTNKVAAAILEAKVCYKIRNTFVASIRKYATKGRIHCTFNQLRSQRENSDDLFGAAPGRISCVPKSNSEILTERGWLRWNQLEVGERVMGYNVTTGEYEWTRLRGVHDNGEATVGLIKATRGHGTPGEVALSQGFYCTANHRWIVDHPTISGFITAGSRVRGLRKLLVPTKSMPTPTDGKSLLNDAQAFLLGWYLTDGWKRQEKRQHNRSMCVGVLKPSSVKQLTERLTEYGLMGTWVLHKTYRKMLPGKDHLRTVHYFYVRAGYFESILRQVELKDPAEVILSLSSSARQAMLDAMMEGDGSQRRTRKASSFGAVEDHTKQTWEFFTLLKVALGQPYGVCRNLTKAKTPFLHFWSIQGNLCSPTTVWNPTGMADTWCPTTELGTWVMRQGPRICVTGNCADPNLQQQPARHPVYGKLWRSIYLPDEGGQWAACDYSQQEPRLLVHYAELSGCPGAKDMADKFRNDLKTDLHDETTKLAYPELVPGTPEFKKTRKDKCKIIFLGLCYSMGQAKLCMSLGYPTELVVIDGKERRVAGAEGKAFLKSFNEKVPFLEDLVKKVQRVAWSRAYIITILGRHCRFPKGEKEERKALNRLIQGSAADQTKLAMVECDRAGVPLQLQIHDELGFTIYDRSEAEKAADIMKNCITLTVPSKVDIEIGPSWGGSM